MLKHQPATVCVFLGHDVSSNLINLASRELQRLATYKSGWAARIAQFYEGLRIFYICAARLVFYLQYSDFGIHPDIFSYSCCNSNKCYGL